MPTFPRKEGGETGKIPRGKGKEAKQMKKLKEKKSVIFLTRV